jgi:microcystin-dependent protein
MSEPFLGEIRIFSFDYAPRGWMACNGQLLPINQNQALFSLLGTMYGGNGQTTFALPDLRGRVPFHLGQGLVQGQAAGQEFHTVTSSEMPAHTHVLRASSKPANLAVPNLGAWASTSAGTNFSNGLPNTSMQAGLVSTVGGGQSHENRQPYLTLTFAIALQGVFPSRN